MCRRTIALGAAVALAVVLVPSCGGGRDMVEVPDEPGRMKTAAAARAERRAYDGAPPVIPHENFRIECIECHGVGGIEVPGVGYSPPSPHAETRGMSAMSRCRQCHVFARTDDTFIANRFVGLQQDLRAGKTLYHGAPPVMPHKEFMRENCLACHDGPTAREEIRTTHPQRVRCRQCHASAETRETFVESEFPIDG